MGTLKIVHNETYSIEVNLSRVELGDTKSNATYRLVMKKNDSSEHKSQSSSVEYYLTRKELTHLAQHIMETLNDK